MHAHKVVVLLHERDADFTSTKYLIQLLMQEWERMGISVETVRGTKHFVPADLIVPHIDLTITPPEYRAFLLRYPNVLNRHVVDISKSTISTNLVSRNDTDGGPVIVKTNCNSGGLPERRLLPKLGGGSSWHRLRRRIGSMLRRAPTRTMAWKRVDHLMPGKYPVFPTVREVPEEVFGNKNLIVEKFLPEREGDSYRVRYYHFFGDREINITFRSKKMIVKGDSGFEFEVVPAPPDLRSIRQRLGFDYGKFDYVLRDGKVVLFDVNRTPAYVTLEVAQLAGRVAQCLAEGIWAALDS